MEVLYPGLPGAFAEEAARFFAEGGECRPVAHLQEAVARAAHEERAVVPLESSLAGEVPSVQDLLWQHRVSILGEHRVRVRLALIGAPGSSLERVERVASHGMALAQCGRWLQAYPRWVTALTSSTAAAVAEVVERRDPTFAAIAAPRAASLFGAVVLADAIEDPPGGFTRFVLIGGPGAEAPVTARRKATLAFTLPHRPGSLAKALAVLADRDLDLSRLGSRPLPDRPFEYAFHADVVGPDEALAAGLHAFAAAVTGLHVLGTYPCEES